MSPKKSPPRAPKRAAPSRGKAGTFTDDEREAMQERARELKAEAGGAAAKGDGEAEVLAKIAAMPEADRALARRFHDLVRAAAPGLVARTWYGMPAYTRDGKVVCFFQSAHKFKSRYATIGFSDQAKLDAGAMWPTGFALTSLTAAEASAITALVKRAVS